jgi:hypothetical protein
MSIAHGQCIGGIRDLPDIYDRCLPKNEIGCRIWKGAVADGAPQAWFSPAHCARSVTNIFGHLLGKTDGKHWFPMVCLDKTCCSVEHRKLATMSEWMKARRPKLNPAHVAKITSAARSRHWPSSADDLAEIAASTDRAVDVGAKFGISKDAVWKIRRTYNRGLSIRGGAVASSVFSWSGGSI